MTDLFLQQTGSPTKYSITAVISGQIAVLIGSISAANQAAV
jgi:hypothetical protein